MQTVLSLGTGTLDDKEWLKYLHHPDYTIENDNCVRHTVSTQRQVFSGDTVLESVMLELYDTVPEEYKWAGRWMNVWEHIKEIFSCD